MDKDELQKNIALYYSKLPQEAQEFFSGQTWLETLRKISTKYDLSEGQQETLGTETTLILLGIIHPDEYEEILKKELLVNPDTLGKILLEINMELLGKIRPELIETFEANNAVEEKIAPKDIEGKLDNRFEKLPKDIRDIVGESNYQTSLYDISREHKLTIEQMGSLEESLVDVMLARISAEKFEEEIKNKVKLPEDETREIIRALNEKILKGIREKMMASKPSIASVMNKEEMGVLGDAGIKIVDPAPKVENTKSAPIPVSMPVAAPKPDLKELELPAGPVTQPLVETKTPTLVALEPEITAPAAPVNMLAKKFADSFKMPTTKTDMAGDMSTKKIEYPKGADPYRLAPEE